MRNFKELSILFGNPSSLTGLYNYKGCRINKPTCLSYFDTQIKCKRRWKLNFPFAIISNPLPKYFSLPFPLLHFMLTALLCVLIIFCLCAPVSGTFFFFPMSQHQFSSSPICCGLFGFCFYIADSRADFLKELRLGQILCGYSKRFCTFTCGCQHSKTQGAKAQKRRDAKRSKLGWSSLSHWLIPKGSSWQEMAAKSKEISWALGRFPIWGRQKSEFRAC